MRVSKPNLGQKLFKIWLLGAIGIAALVQNSYSMEFSTVKRFGDTVIVGDGRIISGDDARLSAIAKKADVLHHGYGILELNSPGGNVDAALSLAKVIREKEFHTVITAGSECASACGAILFVAGHLRTMENGSRLGMHTCYDSQTSMSDEQCNDEIGQHAFSNGIAHGAVYAYMRAVPPQDMLWLDRERAECAGLTKYFMENRNDFSAIGPCFKRVMSGTEPDPAMKWRIKRKRGGFSAFVRSHSDYQEVAQTEIYCSEKKPGIIHISATMPAGNNTSASRFEKMTVELDNQAFSTTRPIIEREGSNTRFTYELPTSEVKTLLTSYTSMLISLKFEFDPDPFSFGALLTHGRKALLFAANHCMP